jgi:hypothetical protein
MTRIAAHLTRANLTIDTSPDADPPVLDTTEIVATTTSDRIFAITSPTRAFASLTEI